MKKKSLGHYVSMIYRHLQIHLNQEFSRFGFGSGQYLYFIHIAKHKGITQKELSRKLAIDKATTAKAVKKLQELGYIRSEQSRRDKRIFHLYLTLQGRKDITRNTGHHERNHSGYGKKNE